MLVTQDFRRRLLRNGREPHADHTPLLKIFDPGSSCTWLITLADPDDPDRLYGLCDLGQGCPELGYVSLLELQVARNALGVPLERDLYFHARHPISVYARAARDYRHVTESEAALEAAAAAIANDAMHARHAAR